MQKRRGQNDLPQRQPPRGCALLIALVVPALGLGLSRATAIAAATDGGVPAKGPAPALARGRIIDPVPCLQDPTQTYALYLPSRYSPERAWPVLFVLDARGRGALAADRFRAAAEQLGYVVLSSNRSRSDGPDAPNFAALKALWPESHARFHIDDRRVYGAGFSGTVRSLCSFARAVPGLFAGLIGSAAGFPVGAPPQPSDRFAFFGAVGDQDFNYYELLELEPQLAAAGLHHRIELFDGGHQWPPEPVVLRALNFLELQAMQSGTLAPEPSRIAAAVHAAVERARAAEAAGDRAQAVRLWSEAATDAPLLPAGSAEPDALLASRRKAELAADTSVQRELRELAERRRRDADFADSAPLLLLGRKPPSAADAQPLSFENTVEQLRIRELQAQARSSASREDRKSAQRLLGTLRIYSSAYLPQQLMEKQRYDRAAFVLSVALVIDPDDPRLYCARAAARARLGDRARALTDLRRALALGFRDGETLRADPGFAALKTDAEFQQILQSLLRPASR